MKYCSNCGAVMGDSMTKCNSCGAAFEDTSSLSTNTPTNDTKDADTQTILDATSNDTSSVTTDPQSGFDANTEASSSVTSNEDPVVTLETGEDDFVKAPEFPEDLQNEAASESEYGSQNTYNQNNPHDDGQYGQPAYGGAGGGNNGTVNGEKSSFFDNLKGQNGEISGTLGLVISIIALALVVIFGLIGTCGGAPTVGLIFVIIGIILSVVGLIISNKDRRATNNTCSFATTAFVLSLIALILGVILLIIGISCLGCIACVACSGLNALNSIY